ncbi:MAG: ATP-binding protein, partial [Schaedlerella arabinosiphila]|nr:ATP-binding protein [Schaedlerella arabinosiphila]
GFPDLTAVWTADGAAKAVKKLLAESNTLFDDMVKKLNDFPELRQAVYAILFKGEKISFSVYNHVFNLGVMFGFMKEENDNIVISNRIFEMQLYNLFISEELLDSVMYKSAARDKDRNLFIRDGRLDMEQVLVRFTETFTDIYGDAEERFLEENGRRFFLLYWKPIINGAGNYYIESRTRNMRRTDVIVDFRGEQFVCELKIWHGEEYNKRGEEQLLQYLDDYHLTTGYMLSFNFNQKKNVGVRKMKFGKRTIIEAVV